MGCKKFICLGNVAKASVKIILSGSKIFLNLMNILWKAIMKKVIHTRTGKRVIKIGTILLDTSKNVCVTNVFQDITCDVCGPRNAMCFGYSW